MSRKKFLGGVFAVALILAAILLKSKEVGFDTASDLLRMHGSVSRAVTSTGTQQKSARVPSSSASNEAVAAAGEAGVKPGSASPSEESEVIKFMSQKAPGKWSAEAHDGRVVSVFGGKVKASLVGSDEKLLNFVSEMAGSLGYDAKTVAPVPELKKVTDHEIINEFKQTINNVDVYGAYFRAFRDGDNNEANFFITEFKKFDQVDATSAVEISDVLTKLDEYYSRLGNDVKEKSCSEQKVFFVDEAKVARLAYKCIVKATAQLPLVYEVVVSAANSDVLFQKRMTIYN